MKVRVCLVSTGQPSTNPRLVKEADALAAAGFDVHAICSHWADWADQADAPLLAGRRWSCETIDWRRGHAPWLFWKTRVRHHAARLVSPVPLVGQVFAPAAAGRLTPELTAAALGRPADLYIAHNLGALPAAAEAAAHHGARLGFDAEDYHSGMLPPSDVAEIESVRYVEGRYLPLCDYVTAASPLIGAAYAPLCRRPPVVVLNVFPRAERPSLPVPRRDGPLRLYWFSQTIGRGRGLEDAVAAMGQLRGRKVELHLRGVWQPGFQVDLDLIARNAGVDLRSIVVHEPASPSDMVRLAAEYDVGLAIETSVTPNAEILLSNKIFTYLLAGIAVLASATRAQVALSNELGRSAVLAPVGDAGALAEAIIRWIDEPDALRAARRAAWHLGETRFNWDREQETFLQAVRTALLGSPGGVRSGELAS
jgi:glycosyltransferase involved in cell wall biosynthesis